MATSRDSYLVDFLRESTARVVNFDKWLICTDKGVWEVYQRAAYKKTTTCLYSGESLQFALDVLK